MVKMLNSSNQWVAVSSLCRQFIKFKFISNPRKCYFCYLKFRVWWSFGMGLCISKHQSDGDESDHHFEFASANVHLITNKESWDQKLAEANRDGRIVIANFSAMWCGPCKMIAPLYSELSEKYPSLMFLVVDVDELTEFSTSWDIKATPTFFFLKNGEQIDKLVGANKPELQNKIAVHSDSAPVA